MMFERDRPVISDVSLLASWGVAPLEVRLERLNDTARLFDRFHERARYWVEGEASWLLEDHLNGDIAICLKFRPGMEAHPAANDRYPAYLTATLHSDVVEVHCLHSWDDQPVLVDVVGSDYPPQKVTPVSSSVLCAERLDLIEDDCLKLWVVPRKFLHDMGTGSGFSGVFRIKGPLEIVAFLVEREDGRVVGQASPPGQSANKVIKRRPQIPDAVTNGSWEQKVQWQIENGVSVIGLHFSTQGGIRIMMNGIDPSFANLVGVYLGAPEFDS